MTSFRRVGNLLEAFGRPLGSLCGVFRPSWRHLGRFVAQEAVTNSQKRPQTKKGPKRTKKTIVLSFFIIFSIYLAPSGAKYCEKGLAVTKTGEG